jgi:acyl-[acyl-carrier-protein]-phospholipid O-acyltransferase/long-chain-fatty-acid--[acyl-carrier-protein] ligase
MLSVCSPGTVLLGCLPVFHSFGFTVTLWFPLLGERKLVTSPSPLETRRLVDAIREEEVTVLVTAPTFLRPFLQKARPGELRSLRQVVTGAEKLPEALAQDFQAAFGLDILEGYGLTEASPVCTVNQPDPPVTTASAGPQRARKRGTVGRLLPGMSGRVTDPDTGAELAATATGVIGLRGPNLFAGYLGADGRIAPEGEDGWFATWDLGHFDAEGFLTIEGRSSRFSKMGGEMVPHGAIEERIIALFELSSAEGPPVFVAGVPDEGKGEILVLLTVIELSAAQLREGLQAAGLPNLWIPRIVRRVEKIPLLGSGKLDLAAGRALARAAAAAR